LRVNKRSIVFLLLAASVLCFSSCASRAAVRETRPYVWLTNNAKFILLPPAYIETPLDHQQLISASFQGRNHQMAAWVKADETGIDMTLMSELGATVGELFFRDGAVSFSSPLFPRAIGGEHIIADFQLSFYNAAALASALEAGGLTFEEAGTARRVFEGGTLIVEIERSRTVVRLVNHLRGYSLTLEGDFERDFE